MCDVCRRIRSGQLGEEEAKRLSSAMALRGVAQLTERAARKGYLFPSPPHFALFAGAAGLLVVDVDYGDDARPTDGEMAEFPSLALDWSARANDRFEQAMERCAQLVMGLEDPGGVTMRQIADEALEHARRRGSAS